MSVELVQVNRRVIQLFILKVIRGAGEYRKLVPGDRVIDGLKLETHAKALAEVTRKLTEALIEELKNPPRKET